MTNLLRRSIFALALATTVSAVAHANTGDPISKPPTPPPPAPPARPYPAPAPEVDLNLAFGGLTLLAGTTTVLRSRRGR